MIMKSKRILLLITLSAVYLNAADLPGYSSLQKSIKKENDPCYKATMKVSNPMSKLVLSAKTSFTTFSTAILELAKSQKFLLFNQYTANSFFQEVQHYSFSLYYLFTFQYDANFTAEGYGDDILTDKGKEVMYSKKDKNNISTICGDEFISKARIINYLAINIVFHSNSLENYKKYESSKNVEILGLKMFISKVSQEAREKMLNGDIEFQVQQVGGDKNKLSVFMNKVDTNNNVFALSCRLGENEACLALVDKIFEYAEKGFPRQLDSEMKTITFENAQVVSKIQLKFLGLDIPSLKISSAARVAQCKIDKLYQIPSEMIREFIASKELLVSLNSYESVSIVIDNFIERLKRNIVLFTPEGPFYGDIVRCSNYPEECVNTLNKIMSKYEVIRTLPSQMNGLIYNQWANIDYNYLDCN